MPELTGNLPERMFIPGVSGQADSYQQTEKSYALFTNETYTLIEHLDLTAGLRYTHESKDETANYAGPEGGSACGQLLRAPTPSAALPYNQLPLLGYGCATPFPLLNARIGIGAPDGKWAFEVWGQNLADNCYLQLAFDAPFQGLAVPGFNNQIDSFVGDPRTFGATLRVKF